MQTIKVKTIFLQICFWQYLWLSSIHDHRLSMQPSKGYRGAFCSVCPSANVTPLEDSTLLITSLGLPCWAHWDPNRISPTNRIVRFVMHTKGKASYRMVQYKYVYRDTILKSMKTYFLGRYWPSYSFCSFYSECTHTQKDWCNIQYCVPVAQW